MKVFNFWRKREGFTLIETMVSVALVSILVCATITIFKSQAIFASRSGELSEMQDNLRIASCFLTKDIREAVEVKQLGTDTGKGPGPNKENAFQIMIREGETEKTVSYFYGKGTDSITNVFYRDIDNDLQPLTNEYTFGNTTKGYVRKWKVVCYKSDGSIVTDITDIKKVRIVTFTLYGSYGDKPDDFKLLSSSAYIRSEPTTP
jgi:prepilin-type N-terminal cleavage/methylation domain-containing protein